MLKRKVMPKLDEWRLSPSKRALLVTGARQIGKTYIIREFAKSRYDNFVELNLALDATSKDIFNSSISAEEILLRLSVATRTSLNKGKTCIFLDEIQEAPEIMTTIKALVEKGNYDFILSGSLLGVELKNIRSNPVGSVKTLLMYPLDFEEFCWANGIGDEVFDYLKHCYSKAAEIDGEIHKQMLDLYKKYIIVGGMPDAVKTYINSNDLTMVRDVQDAIHDWYKTDISKYCPAGNNLKAKEAYSLIPSELNNQNKRFVLKSLNQLAKFRTYEDAFLWLGAANVALPVYNVSEARSPLLVSKQRNLFKLFYSDVGLLMSTFSKKSTLSLLNGDTTVNYGCMFENAVAQELVAHGFDLYYYNNKSKGEVDFIIEDKDGVVTPIEVKSGKNYRRHSAINNLMNIKNFDIDRAIVLSQGNIEIKDKVLHLPIYTSSLLENI